MRITLASVFVDDQSKALRFYTEVLGFRTKMEIPLGEYRWLTVAAAEGREDLQLALEPNANPAAKTYQQALFDQGIPATAFESDDLDGEYARLRDRGVVFTSAPTDVGAVRIA